MTAIVWGLLLIMTLLIGKTLKVVLTYRAFWRWFKSVTGKDVNSHWNLVFWYEGSEAADEEIRRYYRRWRNEEGNS